MDQAWLNSLSEDWLSEPRSPTVSHPSLPGTSKSSKPFNSSSRRSSTNISRIPISKSRSTSGSQKDNALPLGERSPSSNNISPTKPRRLSVLQNELGRGRKLSRTLSASTTNSTQPDTVNKKSLSSSPVKDRRSQDTPEWKRRLLHGDVAYGEKCDLFSAAGLEKLFSRPPIRDSPVPKENMSAQQSEIVFPSSPPSYLPARLTTQQIREKVGKGTTWSILEEEDNSIALTERVEESLAEQGQPEKPQSDPSRRGPKAITFKMMDALSSQDFSENDLSQGSNFLLEKVLQTSAQRRKGLAPEASSDLGSRTRERSSSLPGRIVSGQSNQSNITRDEGLTPIYVTLNGSATHAGGITYGRGAEWDALDLADSRGNINPEELQSRLQAVESDSKVLYSDEASILVEETRDTTEDFAHNGKFVNIGRGGRSTEGSFRRRPLSPSSLPPIDELRSSREASPQTAPPKIPKIRMTEPSSAQEPSDFSPIPKASCSPSPDRVEGAKTSSGASQLKIFGSHDTFTSKKLLRRLSQFEETFQETGESGDEDITTANPRSDRKSTASTVKYTGEARADVDGSNEAESLSPTKKPRRISNFGEGELDDYDFSDGSPDDEASGWRRHISGFKWNDQIEEPEVVETRIKHKTAKIKDVVEAESSSRPTSSSSAESKSSGQKEVLATPRKASNGDSVGKRLRISPYKDPTPKRRRTLMPADTSDPNLVQEQCEEIQSAKSRKRKDARHQDDNRPADPTVMASRQILRPRIVSRAHSSADPNGRPNSQSSEMDDDQRRELEEQTKRLAKIHAEMNSDMPNKPKPFGHFPHLQGNRKASITTQDYLDDAKKIMAAIREKARPRSAMTSNESESEHGPGSFDAFANAYEDTDEDSTPEAFERPPSREGNRPVPRMPHKQDDPEIIKHLKKYQETSEKLGLDDAVNSSMKQLTLARAATKAPQGAERSASATISRIATARTSMHPEIFESEPPNIRISESPVLQRKRKHQTSETNNAEDVRMSSQGSSGSSSFPSASSRGSERRVIAPEKINHLIPEQVAGMVFDRQRNIWIRHKISGVETKGPNPLPSEDTEDDPFGDIPDLSVDEAQEMLGVKAAAARKREELRSDPMPAVEEVSEETQGFKHGDSGNDLEEISAEEFSRAQINRATSATTTDRAVDSQSPQRTFEAEEDSLATNPYESPEMLPVDVSPRVTSQTTIHSNHDTFNRVTAMITELKARANEPLLSDSSRPEPDKGKQDATSDDEVTTITPKPARNVTIHFSSPVASIIKDVAFETSFNSEWDEDSQMGQDSLLRSRNSTPSINRPSAARKSSLKMRSSFQPTPRGAAATDNNTFPIRQVSTIKEQDENPDVGRFNSEVNQTSLSLVNNLSPVVSPPVNSNHLEVSTTTRTPINDRQIDLRFDASLNLTPMSEFTMHQRDQSIDLEVSYIGQRRHFEPSTKSRTLSVSVNQLVEKLTDVEPCEPYWEHLKQINLHNKGLSSLHMLDEFCGALIELDVSNNKIDQNDGVPASVRHFNVAHNSLSDLSSWGHLINLQYVDVSNNDLTSLRGFKSLVHLRSLRADNNSITSLDGVTNLDGLLSLRLRGNQLESVDFMDTALKRLTELDLKGNGLTSVCNIHELKSLAILNLDENELENFPAPPQDLFFSLKYLKLCGNRISRINVSRYPNLRLLYLDRNCLGKVTGLYRTRYLDSLSMREQRDSSILDMTFLDEVYEVRKLFLSGNLLPSFNPRVDFLNLQFLELANCGLRSLPENFGQIMANIRTLNLNFNALRDASPLLGINRLKNLHLAGNRLYKWRATTTILSEFRGISKVDIRNNPMTQGFYPSALEKRMIFQEIEGEEGEAMDGMDAPQPFTLGMADAGLDARYSSRLDMETRSLRRLYEMWMVKGCPRLKILDGLTADKNVLQIRDDAWDSLVRAEVLGDMIQEEENAGMSRDAEAEAEVQDADNEQHERDEDAVSDGDGENGIETEDAQTGEDRTILDIQDANPNGNRSRISQRECDTPRPSIEQDDSTDSASINNASEKEDWEELPIPEMSEDEDEEEVIQGKVSSIWGAEDSFA